MTLLLPERSHKDFPSGAFSSHAVLVGRPVGTAAAQVSVSAPLQHHRTDCVCLRFARLILWNGAPWNWAKYRRPRLL